GGSGGSSESLVPSAPSFHHRFHSSARPRPGRRTRSISATATGPPNQGKASPTNPASTEASGSGIRSAVPTRTWKPPEPPARAPRAKACPVRDRADRPAVLDVRNGLGEPLGELLALDVWQRRDRADREHVREPLVARARDHPHHFGLPQRLERGFGDRFPPEPGEHLADPGGAALGEGVVEDSFDLVAHRRLGITEIHVPEDRE